MALVKDRRVVEDDWLTLDDDTPVPANMPVIVSLARWQQDKDSLSSSGTQVGVLLTGDDAVDDVADALDRIDLVALAFPAFTDGRAYSMARVLRERYGYTGEIRAVGNVLRDQASLMARCGFDAFDLPEDIAVEEWLEALSEISVLYQPAADRRRAAPDLRHS